MKEILSKQEFENRIRVLNPEAKIEVVDFTTLDAPATIHCLECGEDTTMNRAYKILGKLNPCSKEKHHRFIKWKAEAFGEKYGFTILDWGKEKKSYAKLKCNKCGAVYYKKYDDLLATPDECPGCDGEAELCVSDQAAAQRAIDERFGAGEYELLDFKSACHRATLRHSCGFTWKVRYDSFIKSRGCPKCNKKMNNGEAAIQAWLEERGIAYEWQKEVEGLDRKLDFFLPEKNVVIEYLGQQYYNEKLKLHKKSLANLKKEEEWCAQKGIAFFSIPYTELDNLPAILTSRFND